MVQIHPVILCAASTFASFLTTLPLGKRFDFQDLRFDLLPSDIIAITMATPSEACLPDKVSSIRKGQMDTQDGKESFPKHRPQPSQPRIGSLGPGGCCWYTRVCVPTRDRWIAHQRTLYL